MSSPINRALPTLTMYQFEGGMLETPTYTLDEGEYHSAAWSPLPPSIDTFITTDLEKGKQRSWKEGGVSKSDLAYVQMTHWDMQQQLVVGELVVHKELIHDVMGIARDIFNAKFPIESQRLIDYWDANDEASMTCNNSSCLCVRVIAGTLTTSQHAHGRAWDINTMLNPYHQPTTGYTSPENGKKYVDRTLTVAGMIKDGDVVVCAFKERGWEWGGGWKSCLDWQHFQKPASST